MAISVFAGYLLSIILPLLADADLTIYADVDPIWVLNDPNTSTVKCASQTPLRYTQSVI